MPIRIVPPDPDWPIRAAALIDAWHDACGAKLLRVHHIGSTSVSGLPAKPVIDLLPVFESSSALDAARPAVIAMGFEWLGPYGLPGRRYSRRNHQNGRREVQSHAYAVGDASIARHLAFRDALRADAALRNEYAALKEKCAAQHPNDMGAYGACKGSWIAEVEARALHRP